MTKNKKLKRLARAQQARMGSSYTTARAVVIASGRPTPARLLLLIEGLLPLTDAFAVEASEPREIRLGAGYRSLDLFSRKRPAEDALRAALSRLSLDTLHVIETVMYAGRDLGDAESAQDFRAIHADLPRDDLDLTISNLRSKLPLPQYLRRGLALADRLGVDLDALPPSPRSPMLRGSR